MEQKDETFKLLIESLKDTTEEMHRLKQREITLLQLLLDAEKKIEGLVTIVSEYRFSKEKTREF